MILLRYITLFVVLISLTDNAVRCEKLPQRIISLGPALTERIFLLESGDSIIANTLYCKRPAGAEKKEKIGSLTAIDIEKIVSLKPDLICAIPLNGKKTVKKLKKLGIKTVVFKEPASFEELFSEFNRLAKLIGKEKRATEIISDARKKLKSIKSDINKEKKPKVFFQIGANPLFTATGDSFVNDFMEYAGGINIAKKSKNGLYSREEVLKANPDVIFIITMGIAGEREKEIWSGYSSMNAAQNRRIHIVDAYDICSPSPLILSDSVKMIREYLYPQKRK